MAITTLAQLVAAPKQRIQLLKTDIGTISVATHIISTWNRGPIPSAGGIGAGSTTSGRIVTATQVGAPALQGFNGGKGYVSAITMSGGLLGGRATLYDRIWEGGNYAWQSSYTLSSLPDITGRLPNGTSWVELELFAEIVTQPVGNFTIEVRYTGEDGTTGRTAGAFNFGAGTAVPVRRLFPIQLQAGDKGTRMPEQVITTVSTDGFFNLVLMRRLCSITCEGRGQARSPGESRWDFLKTGLPEIFESSALMMAYPNPNTASTTAPSVDVNVEIAVG